MLRHRRIVLICLGVAALFLLVRWLLPFITGTRFVAYADRGVWSKDGQALFYAIDNVRRHDIRTGWTATYRVKPDARFDVSPDGRSVAYVRYIDSNQYGPSRICIDNLQTGHVSTVYRTRRSIIDWNLFWLPGSRLLFPEQRPDGRAGYSYGSNTYLLSLGSTKPALLIEHATPRFAAYDGSCFIYQTIDSPARYGIYDLGTGKSRSLNTGLFRQGFDLGEMRPIYLSRRWFVYYASAPQIDPRHSTHVLDLKTMQSKALDLQCYGGTISPDTRHYTSLVISVDWGEAYRLYLHRVPQDITEMLRNK